jgi:hypothetical protein
VSVEAGGSGKRNVVVVQDQNQQSAGQTQQSHSRKKERHSGGRQGQQQRERDHSNSNQSQAKTGSHNWYLKDPKGSKLGPFTSRELVNWFEAGLMVCEGDGGWDHLTKQLKKTTGTEQSSQPSQGVKEQHPSTQTQNQNQSHPKQQQEINNKSAAAVAERTVAPSSKKHQQQQEAVAAAAPPAAPAQSVAVAAPVVPAAASPVPSPANNANVNEKRRGGPKESNHNTPSKKATPKELFTAGASQPMDEPVWRYVDNEGQIQGPWTSKQMISWYQQGYFDMDLLVVGCDRKICPPNLPKMEEYVALGKLIQAPSQRSSGNEGKGSRYNNHHGGGHGHSGGGGYRRGGRKHNNYHH